MISLLLFTESNIEVNGTCASSRVKQVVDLLLVAYVVPVPYKHIIIADKVILNNFSARNAAIHDSPQFAHCVHVHSTTSVVALPIDVV